MNAQAADMLRFELPQGACVDFYEQWIEAPAASAIQAALTTEIPWEHRQIEVYGRKVWQPRLVAWIGDPEAVYTYSRTRHAPLPWTPVLASLRGRVADVSGHAVNSVLCNLYRNGHDSMGMHSDDEPELRPAPVIASLSLGATRRFCIRHRRGSERGALDLELTNGSLLIMHGSTQQHYRHGVPKQPRVCAPRINLTFRKVQPLAR